MTKIKKICICGAHWEGTISNNFAKSLLAKWDKVHTGKGHKPCDSITAYDARSTEYIDWTK